MNYGLILSSALDELSFSMDGAPVVSQKGWLQEHDDRFHGGHYDENTMSCGLRDKIMNSDNADRLTDAISPANQPNMNLVSALEAIPSTGEFRDLMLNSLETGVLNQEQYNEIDSLLDSVSQLFSRDDAENRELTTAEINDIQAIKELYDAISSVNNQEEDLDIVMTDSEFEDAVERMASPILGCWSRASLRAADRGDVSYGEPEILISEIRNWADTSTAMTEQERELCRRVADRLEYNNRNVQNQNQRTQQREEEPHRTEATQAGSEREDVFGDVVALGSTTDDCNWHCTYVKPSDPAVAAAQDECAARYGVQRQLEANSFTPAPEQGCNCYLNDTGLFLQSLGFPVNIPGEQDDNAIRFRKLKSELANHYEYLNKPSTEEMTTRIEELKNTAPFGTWISVWMDGHNIAFRLEKGRDGGKTWRKYDGYNEEISYSSFTSADVANYIPIKKEPVTGQYDFILSSVYENRRSGVTREDLAQRIRSEVGTQYISQEEIDNILDGNVSAERINTWRAGGYREQYIANMASAAKMYRGWKITCIRSLHQAGNMHPTESDIEAEMIRTDLSSRCCGTYVFRPDQPIPGIMFESLKYTRV